MPAILLLSLVAGVVAFVIMSRPFSVWPVLDPRVTSPFGWRIHPVTGEKRFHNGTDFKAAHGAALISIGAGIVVRANSDSVSGLHAIVQGTGAHAAFSWSYSHASRLDVAEGQSVAPGDVIGAAGASGRVTGPHLHFVIRKDGQPIDPMTVLPMLGSSEDPDEEQHA